MTEPAYHAEFRDRAEREALNDALLADGAETGFWTTTAAPHHGQTTSTNGHSILTNLTLSPGSHPSDQRAALRSEHMRQSSDHVERRSGRSTLLPRR